MDNVAKLIFVIFCLFTKNDDIAKSIFGVSRVMPGLYDGLSVGFKCQFVSARRELVLYKEKKSNTALNFNLAAIAG